MKTIFPRHVSISESQIIETHVGQHFLNIMEGGAGAVILSMENTLMPTRPLEIKCFSSTIPLPETLMAEYNYIGSVKIGYQYKHFFAERK